jgi:outer membrane immunogenic protein
MLTQFNGIKAINLAVAALGLPVAAFFMSGPVQAQDWTGPYIGAHAGWVQGDWNGPLSYDDASLYPALHFDSSNRKINDNSWIAGVQAGYDYQWDRVVLGMVADVSWTDLSGTGTFIPYPANGPNPEWNIKTNLDVFGTVRGRLGYVLWPGLMIYGTGGFAWGHGEASNDVFYVSTPCAGGPCASGHADGNHLGWAAGGGAEWKLTHNWSLSAEYLFVDLGTVDYGFEGKTAPELGSAIYGSDHFHADLQLQTVRIGLNYRFGEEAPLPIVPLK